MNALITCVGYDDYLRRTLPRNAPHFDRVCVVTSPEDERTQLAAGAFENVFLHVTAAFTANGGPFNKGAALEEAFDALGRYDWLCILDADVILPAGFLALCGSLDPACLHVPRRRMCVDPAAWSPDRDWAHWPVNAEPDFAGYCQIFNACESLVRDVRPWYCGDWPGANGPDTEFNRIWPPAQRCRPEWHVLHLGPTRVNWRGRVSPRIG